MKLRHMILAVFATGVSLTAQIPDFTPPNPLFAAVLNNDNAEVQRLLSTGVNPNEGRFVGAPALHIAIMQHNAPITRALLESGADIKATDGAGSSALMWAAASETSDPTLVEELLTRGADPNLVNKMGDTALTWAMRRGYTPVVDSLKRQGAADTALIRQSVEKAVALLQKSGPEFVKVSGCSSCHHQSLPQMAYGEARKRGFHVDSDISEKQVKSVIAMFRPYTEQMKQGKQNIPDPSISVSYSLIGLAAEGYKADATTAAMAHLISTQQVEDGSFRVFSARPPIESSVFSATALSLRALQLYGAPEDAARVVRARAWLSSAKPVTNEDRAMQLLGLAWANAPVEDLAKSAESLLAEQRPDGGWAQLPGVESDAYATGQAMSALQAAGKLPANSAAYQRGVSFLLRTQRPDGSWLVRSRVFPFQPYKESGFPYGKDQWISASGTSWAVMALAQTAAETPQQLTKAF